jgi:hypothetical protein
MTPEARAELLLSYASGPGALKEALGHFPAECLDFTDEPGHWSIQTMVLHLAESELQGYLRGRTIIAEPGTAIVAYDQDRWAQTLDPMAQPLTEAVELVRLLREMMARQLRGLPETAWTQSVQHPDRGEVTLERWLEIYDNHLKVHLNQMEKAYAAWSHTFPGA